MKYITELSLVKIIILIINISFNKSIGSTDYLNYNQYNFNIDIYESKQQLIKRIISVNNIIQNKITEFRRNLKSIFNEKEIECNKRTIKLLDSLNIFQSNLNQFIQYAQRQNQFEKALNLYLNKLRKIITTCNDYINYTNYTNKIKTKFIRIITMNMKKIQNDTLVSINNLVNNFVKDINDINLCVIIINAQYEFNKNKHKYKLN